MNGPDHPPVLRNVLFIFRRGPRQNPEWVIGANTLYESIPEDRALIASFWRCKWLDEAERLQAAFDALPDDKVTPDMPDEIYTAKESAELWRKWETKS